MWVIMWPLCVLLQITCLALSNFYLLALFRIYSNLIFSDNNSFSYLLPLKRLQCFNRMWQLTHPLIFLKKWTNPSHFYFIFGLFKQTIQFLQQINVKKCPSSIWCQDSNPRPFTHESSPITTRPGLPPPYYIQISGQEKRKELQSFAGETVLRGDDFKRYVASLRGKSNDYKKKRGDLSDLRSEYGVLTRTLELLEARNSRDKRY